MRVVLMYLLQWLIARGTDWQTRAKHSQKITWHLTETKIHLEKNIVRSRKHRRLPGWVMSLVDSIGYVKHERSSVCVNDLCWAGEGGRCWEDGWWHLVELTVQVDDKPSVVGNHCWMKTSREAVLHDHEASRYNCMSHNLVLDCTLICVILCTIWQPKVILLCCGCIDYNTSAALWKANWLLSWW